jgi:hypothetical protein
VRIAHARGQRERVPQLTPRPPLRAATEPGYRARIVERTQAVVPADDDLELLEEVTLRT